MKLPLHLTLLLTAAAWPAWAQDRPAITPTRDVAVTYRATTEGQPPGEIRMSWLTARNLMRMDMPGGQGWIVVNLAAGSAFMVTDAQRMVMDMPSAGASARMTPSASARFTREGNARVANTDCVNWRMEDQGQTARVCMTSDGVMLKTESLAGQGPGRGTLEATAIAFGPQDAARFQRPAGYQSLQLPPGMPGGPGGGMPRGTAMPPPGVTMPGR
ncbi:DUF4412 domain-containing protein [Sediminicoccus sp. KRV36]|uniref:DUF4412 domain-containing protein n=1 Tax=Sediminicoccus sp. KRV36 TaxID=3133721 RepID=UPI00200FD96E|nr:DUF4412 domain-containing protein [Sediminicoccus rosea]UPY36201.1 DUF4412 domain-containing protein [Sediminicoccus rosea]